MLSKKTHLSILKALITIGIVFSFLFLFLYAKLDLYLQQYQWQKPVEIFTQGKTLHVGDIVSVQRLQSWLTKSGYNQTDSFNANAQFMIRNNSVAWNSRYDEQQIHIVQLWNNQIRAITQSGQPRERLNLPDVYMGSLFTNSNQHQQLVRLPDVPSAVLDAIIVSEDRDFYQHQGISVFGILRALWTNLHAGKVVQGGSTITQQLIKNQFFDHKQSYWRKAQEAVMAIIIENKLNKDQILEAYLNAIYFGQSKQGPVIGLNAASHYYFDKTPSQLDLNEAVSLAALIRGANYYHPIRHPKRLQARRDRLLKQMVAFQRIPDSAAQAVMGTPLPRVYQQNVIAQQDAFQPLVKRAIQLENVDKKQPIKLTLDPHIQALAKKSIRNALNTINDDKLKASLIAVDVNNGAILALENGSLDAYDGFNYAIYAKRQIGSIIKPFIYYNALQNGASWSDTLLDEPFELQIKGGQVWRPQNFSKEYSGTVTMHHALIKSLNLATAKLCIDQDITQLSALMNRLLKDQWFNPYPSLCLGAADLSILQVAQLYQGLFNQGEYHRLNIIESQAPTQKPYIKLSAQPLIELNQALHDITQQGTAAKMRWQLPNVIAMGKTGTSDQQRDTWFAGLSANSAQNFGVENGILVVVWAGYKDNTPTPYTGSSAALNIWIEFIKELERSE